MCIAGYPQVVMIAKIKKIYISGLKKKRKLTKRVEKGGYIKGINNLIKAQK